MKVRLGKKHFLVKWKGFPHSENSWEVEENLNCPDLVKEYYKRDAKQRKRRKEEIDKKYEGKPKTEETEYHRILETFGDQIIETLKMHHKIDVIDGSNELFTLDNFDSDTIRAIMLEHTDKIVNLYNKYKNCIHKYSVLPSTEALFVENVGLKINKDAKVPNSLGLQTVYFSNNVRKELALELAFQLENMGHIEDLLNTEETATFDDGVITIHDDEKMSK